jgi:hypothetical protein
MKDKLHGIKSNFLDKFRKENKKKIIDSPKIWAKNKIKFRKFWKNKIMNNKVKKLTTGDMKEIIRILDTKASGKKAGEEAVALAGIRQGVWYKSFCSIKKSNDLKNSLNKIFNSKKKEEQIELLNNIERICNKQRILYITSKGAIILNDLLFANDPENNISMVSLRDRYQLISFFELGDVSEIMTLSFGERIIKTRDLIVPLRKTFRLKTNRVLCDFFYFKPLRSEWKTVQVPKKRPEYGEVINFRGFVYAPVNHEGVIALFGNVAKDLGFAVEKVRKEYPDIEAIYYGKKVNIEVEYLNSEFGHHDPKKCDIIVCWRKDTKICPVKKIIELKEEIKRLK